MTINKNIRDLRLISGLTQEEVADRVGLTRQAISSYESGRTQPNLDMLVKLAELYNADVSDILYGWSGEQKKLHTMRIIAIIASAASLLSILVGSCLMLIAHRYFPIPNLLEDSGRALIEMRFAVLEVSELLRGIAQAITYAGCLILAVLLTSLKRLPTLKNVIVSALLFMAGILIFTVPFGAFDKIFGYIDYLLGIIDIFPSVLLFLIYWAMLTLIRKHRSKTGVC